MFSRAIPQALFGRAAVGLAVAALFAGTASVASAQRAAAAGSAEGFVPGRLLVMPRAGMPEKALARIIAEHGGGNARRVGKSELRIIEVPEGLEQEALQRLLRHPHVRFAEFDRLGKFALVPNDPYLGSQWHTQKIGAAAAWDISQGQGVTIAVLDTGTDCTHPDLSAACVAGWNMVDNNSNTADVSGHGTQAAGAAAAISNNGAGVAGIAGQAKIMPIRIGGSNGFMYSDVAAGLTYAADKGVRVANMSIYGALGSSSILSAAQYFKSKGGLVITSAGNAATDPGWSPSTSMITVSATDANDTLASWSNFGRYIVMSAPGVGIWSTTMGSGGTYSAVSGTSFSSPITAGVVALMMAANPALSNTEVESLLFSTAVDLGSAGRDSQFGHGRVNAAAAVAAAANAVTTVDKQAPVVTIAAPLAGSVVSGLVAVDASATDSVGVTKVELRANGQLVASDTVAPFAFSWDSSKVANGAATLVATAYDAAGNAGQSASVGVTVNNVAIVDTTPPTVTLKQPADGAKVEATMTITVAATDNAGPAALAQTLYINGVLVAKASGGTLSYKWNTRKAAAGTYTIKAVAIDAAGNQGTASVKVYK